MPGEMPKYSLIANQLMRDIDAGRYAVGDFLPTERELMRAYGVSRGTVRSAVQNLKHRGVVSSQQGSGSKVVAESESNVFAETIQSIDELIAFGQETRRILVGHETVEADAELGDLFGCSPGRRLVQVRMIRKSIGSNARAVALVRLWMDALLEPVVEELCEMQKSAAEIIQQRFGYKTNSVVQTIQAVRLGADDAQALAVETAAPALAITRVYSAAPDVEPFLVARSLCNAETFRIVSRFAGRK